MRCVARHQLATLEPIATTWRPQSPNEPSPSTSLVTPTDIGQSTPSLAQQHIAVLSNMRIAHLLIDVFQGMAIEEEDRGRQFAVRRPSRLPDPLPTLPTLPRPA